MSALPGSSGFSRRQFLKGIGAGALSLGVGGLASYPASTVWMQPAPMAGRVSAFYSFAVGDFQITAIQDGVGGFPSDFFAANAEPGSVAALLKEQNLRTPEVLIVPLTVLLVESEGRRVLLDTGQGNFALVPDAPPTAGKLLATLELLGVNKESVTDVIVSHFHPDHIFMVSDMQTPTFPEATYHFSKAEYDFLTQTTSTGNEQVDAVIQLANGLLAPVGASDQLKLFEGEAELVPGIQAVPAPGHSPGHTALMISSNGSQLMNMVDTAIHYVAGLAHPDWYFGFDAIPDLAVETRRTLLGRAADEQIPVFGYHFPFPGVGVIDRDGDGFRFVPTLGG